VDWSLDIPGPLRLHNRANPYSGSWRIVHANLCKADTIFPAPEEPDVCSAPLQRRAGSSGAECLSASSEIVGARLQAH
jgi:hypothetical protein